MSDRSKIEWCDATINPLGWGCYGPGGTAEQPNRCPWCYAWRLARRNLRDCPDCRAFMPHSHPEEWAKLAAWKTRRRIFVQSMGDLWGAGAGRQGSGYLLLKCEYYTRHTFLTLTKHARELQDWRLAVPRDLPSNLWLGVSVTNQQDIDERIPWLTKVAGSHPWVSVEPLLGHLHVPLRTRWVVVGAQTGPGAMAPDPKWIRDIAEGCQGIGVPLFMKRSLAKYWDGELIQQFPEGLKP